MCKFLKVGMRVKVIGNKEYYTDGIDGEICKVIKLHDEYAVVQEDCPAKYQWWVKYEDHIPVDRYGNELDIDWLEIDDDV